MDERIPLLCQRGPGRSLVAVSELRAPGLKPRRAGAMPGSVASFCQRLVDRMHDVLPPAFVVDIGVLEDGRWAVVEFNPAWCSGILGADVEGVPRVIERATCS